MAGSIGFGIVLAVLLLGPFFQGLFFPHQQHAAQAAVGAGALLWLLGRGRGAAGALPGWREPLTLASLALLGWYLVATPAAVYPQGHLEVVLNLATALVVGAVVRAELAVRPGLRPWFAAALVAAGVAGAVAALAPYAGLEQLDPDMVRALALVGGDGRLGGTFQYWNVAAIYYLAVAFLAIGLAVAGAPGPGRLAAAAAAAFPLLLGFVLAASRGATVVLPLALTLFVAGLPRGRRLLALLVFLVATAAAVAVSRNFTLQAGPGALARTAGWGATGAVAAAVGGAAVGLWARLGPRVRAATLALAAAGVAAALGWAVARYGAAGAVKRVLPPYAHRLLNITWRDIRLAYNLDALKIIRDHPVLGTGGRGWERLYFRYQDFYYYASEVHNGYSQAAVEAGVPAGLALGGFAVGVLATAWRSRQPDDPASALPWACGAAALAILAHSLLDFDLSYLSILALVWALAAAAQGARAGGAAVRAPAARQAVAPEAAAPWAAPEPGGLAAGARWGVPALALAAAGLVTLGATQGYAAWAVRRADALLAAGNSAGAAALLAPAARLAPLSPDPWARLAQAHRGQPAEIAHIKEAIRRDPENYLWHAQEAEAHLRRHDWAAAADAGLRTVARQPSYYAHYEKALTPLMEQAIGAAVAGQRDQALRLAEEARRLGQQLVERRSRTDRWRHLWPAAQPPLTPEFQLRYGQALALTGHLREALPHLQAAAKGLPLPVQADVWTYLVQTKLGQRPDPALASRPWIRALPTNPVSRILD